VKENDLVHCEWCEWLKTADIITPRTATRMIQAFEQFENGETWHYLPTSKIFEILLCPNL